MDCGFNGDIFDNGQQQEEIYPTEAPIPVPPIPPSEGEDLYLGEGEQYCEVICTAENTPNDQYNEQEDCNWVINEITGLYECVPRDCEWVFYQDTCTWECISYEPEIPSNGEVIPPSEEIPGNGEVCEFTCEDI